jgi:hypothetical protein
MLAIAIAEERPTALAGFGDMYHSDPMYVN